MSKKQGLMSVFPDYAHEVAQVLCRATFLYGFMYVFPVYAHVVPQVLC